MASKELCILVLSCDKNSDLWPPFFAFFRKYWNDCPYKVYLASNYLVANEPNVITLNSNVKSDWSSELKIVLELIPESNVLIILEDYFIYQNVKTAEIEDAVSTMLLNNASFLMLGCFPVKYKSIWKHKPLLNSPNYGEINSSSNYLINLQIGIWNKNVLSNLLVNGESPWQFELEGSKRFAQNNLKSLCVREDKTKNYVHGPITYLCGALTKGVVMRDAIRLCKKENIDFIVKGKKIESQFEEILRRFYIGLPLFVRKGLGFINYRFKKIFN